MRSKDQLDQQRKYAYESSAEAGRALGKNPGLVQMYQLAALLESLIYVGDCVRAHADATTNPSGSSIRHQPDPDPDEPQGAGV